MAANANSGVGVPDAFRKEVEDLKAAMGMAQQMQRAPQGNPVTTSISVKSMMNNTKKLMEMLEGATPNGGLSERVLECMTTVNQSILAIEPVQAAKLGEAIGATDPDAEFLPEEDEDMVSENGLQATAIAIIEQLQGAEGEDAFATVMSHLRSTMKGAGKGRTRFTSPYRA